MLPGAGLGLAGDAEQVPALVGGQPQRAGECGQHRRRRVGGAALLEPGEVVDRDAGELGHLLAAQAGRAPASGRRSPTSAGSSRSRHSRRHWASSSMPPMMAHAGRGRVALRVPF